MASSKEIEYQIAHIDDDRSGTLIASHIICLVLAGIAVCLRLICRRMSKAAIQADDYMIIVAFVSCLYRRRLPASQNTYIKRRLPFPRDPVCHSVVSG